MHLETPDTSSNGKENKAGREFLFTLIGMHKKPLFEKLCQSADKYEQHMQFDDVYFLNFNVDGQEVVVQLTSVGTEHTGNREMSIRKSDAVILCYATHSPHSFQELANVTEDFTMRKKYPPVVLVCNEDELIEEDRLSVADQSSISEGYESDNPGQIKRHASMDKIRQSREDSFVTAEQGEAFSHQLGPDSQFLRVEVSKFDGTKELVLELLRKMTTTKKRSSSTSRRRRSTVVEGLKQIALPFQKSKKNREREESNSSDNSSPETSPSHSPTENSTASIQSVPQIEIQQPIEETVFPTTKSEPTCTKSRSLFRRNQVCGTESQRQAAAQNSHVCSLM